MSFEIDPKVGLLVLAAVILVFVAAMLVPRRPRPAHIPVTEAKLDGIRERLDELERKQNQNDHDVRGIRMAIQGMPTERSVGEMRERLAHMDGRVEGMHDTLTTNGHTLRRIEDYLMNNLISKASE